jgi:hypothetical protein
MKQPNCVLMIVCFFHFFVLCFGEKKNSWKKTTKKTKTNQPNKLTNKRILVNTSCEDGLWCNGDDLCDGSGTCMHFNFPCKTKKNKHTNKQTNTHTDTYINKNTNTNTQESPNAQTHTQHTLQVPLELNVILHVGKQTKLAMPYQHKFVIMVCLVMVNKQTNNQSNKQTNKQTNNNQQTNKQINKNR